MALAGRVYTTGDLAGLLLIAPRTVRKLIDNGTLAATRPGKGRHRRVAHEDLLAFLEAHWPAWREELREQYVGVFGAPDDWWKGVIQRRLQRRPWLRDWLVLLGCERDFE
jgi:excisionase family DNA binding protein